MHPKATPTLAQTCDRGWRRGNPVIAFTVLSFHPATKVTGGKIPLHPRPFQPLHINVTGVGGAGARYEGDRGRNPCTQGHSNPCTQCDRSRRLGSCICPRPLQPLHKNVSEVGGAEPRTEDDRGEIPCPQGHSNPCTRGDRSWWRGQLGHVVSYRPFHGPFLAFIFIPTALIDLPRLPHRLAYCALPCTRL